MRSASVSVIRSKQGPKEDERGAARQIGPLSRREEVDGELAGHQSCRPDCLRAEANLLLMMSEVAPQQFADSSETLSFRGSNERIHVRAVCQLWRRPDCQTLPVEHGAAVPFEIERNQEWCQALGVGLGAPS
jgi:hypothetical protein